MAALVAVGFLYRRGILACYYSWRLDSSDEEARWTAADRLRALDPARAESWYISRLEEDPEWENRKRAAASLGQMRSSRAIQALLQLEHPRCPRDRMKAVASGAGTQYKRIYSMADLVPSGVRHAEDQKLFLEFLESRTEGALSWKGSTFTESTVSLDQNGLFVATTLGAHEALSALLDALRFTRKTLREVGPQALPALEELEQREDADPALRLHALLELSVLRSNHHPPDPPPPVPVAVEPLLPAGSR